MTDRPCLDLARAVVAALLLLSVCWSWGQSLRDVRWESAAADVSQEAVLHIELTPGQGDPWCGLRVDFGNGTGRDIRVGDKGAADLQLRITYRYPMAGLYTVRVMPQRLIRGLNSVSGCGGGSRAVNIRVTDMGASGLSGAAPMPPALPSPPSAEPAPALPYPGMQAPPQPTPYPSVPAPPALPPVAPPPAAMAAAPAAQSSLPRASGPCRAGAAMEARDYAQEEFIGRPAGRKARMCFYRNNGRFGVENLNFYANGHFVMSSITGTGGFAMQGNVLGTQRGTYGFQDGRLALRIGYQGTGVTQSTGSGSAMRQLDVSGTTALERDVVLPNCQKISVRDVVYALKATPAPGHPESIEFDGKRWEHMRIDCPAWQGWQ